MQARPNALNDFRRTALFRQVSMQAPPSVSGRVKVTLLAVTFFLIAFRDEMWLETLSPQCLHVRKNDSFVDILCITAVYFINAKIDGADSILIGDTNIIFVTP